MKKIFTLGFVLLFSLLAPVAVFSAPKKKSEKKTETEISCADIWAAKSKDFKGKRVSTLVLDIAETGTVMSDADAAVVAIETGDKKQAAGGIIFVLMPPENFDAFVKKYFPEEGDAGTAFGGKTDFKQLSAVFEIVGGENVLLYNMKAETLKKLKFSPSEAIEIQRRGKGAMKSEREGFTKKIFNVSKISKKTAAELKRLAALYNRGKKKADKLTEKELKAQCLDDDEFSVTVLDEKAKIEWLIRR
ncbi:MAG: hypothetical protein IKM45_00230 [Opitutales bacterium]|nr:hypothetical protein [Opitutales bacterium]